MNVEKFVTDPGGVIIDTVRCGAMCSCMQSGASSIHKYLPVQLGDEYIIQE